MMIRPLVLLLALTSVAGAEVFPPDLILPFGIPVQGPATATGDTLTLTELASCMIDYQALHDEGARLEIEWTAIGLDQASLDLAGINASPEEQTATLRSDDGLNIPSLSEQKSKLEQRIASYLNSRKSFFSTYVAFVERCATKDYLVDDLKSITALGKQN